MGTHLLVDGILREFPHGYEIPSFLEGMAKRIGMKPIAGPFVIDDGCNKSLTGILIIAESHIKVEVQGDNIWVDVFSCKEFYPVVAEDYIKTTFSLKGFRTQVIFRGWNS